MQYYISLVRLDYSNLLNASLSILTLISLESKHKEQLYNQEAVVLI